MPSVLYSGFPYWKEQNKSECKVMVHCPVGLNSSKVDKDICNSVQLSLNSTWCMLSMMCFTLSGDCQPCNSASKSCHLFHPVEMGFIPKELFQILQVCKKGEFGQIRANKQRQTVLLHEEKQNPYCFLMKNVRMKKKKIKSYFLWEDKERYRQCVEICRIKLLSNS